MTQQDINHFAALSLVERAMQTKTQDSADLLIDTAHALDNSINAESLKREWLENWLAENKNRTRVSVTL